MAQNLDQLGQLINYALVVFLAVFVMWALIVIPLWRCSFYLKEADRRALAAARKAKKAQDQAAAR